jgi:hypothetical protein
MGHAITGGGFFTIDMDPLLAQGPGETFTGIIKFRSSPLSREQLSAELKNLIDELWDWMSCQLSETEFSVVFPSQSTLRMATHSGKLFLPLNKVEVDIREAFLDPPPVAVFPSTWVKVSGLPHSMMEESRLMAAMVMVGRPLEVDLLSLRKFKTELICMRFQCHFTERIRGTIQLVVNGNPFNIGVQAELEPRGGGGMAGDPPRPPGDDSLDDDEHDDLSPSEDEWKCLGKRNAEKKKVAGGAR